MKKTGLVRLLGKHSILLLALLIITSLSIDSKAQGMNDWTGNINSFIGFKKFDDENWVEGWLRTEKVEIDDHFEWGGDVDFKMKSWPVSINFGYLRGSNDDEELQNDEVIVKTSELYIGAKKIFDDFSPIHPFVGAGIARFEAEISTDMERATGRESKYVSDDSSYGFWLGGGVYMTFSEHFNVGINLRYSKAEADIFEEEIEVGGIHYGIIAGYHF